MISYMRGAIVAIILIIMVAMLGCIGESSDKDIKDIELANKTTQVVIKDRQILVNGEPFKIKGVGYSPVPIGESPYFRGSGDYFTSEYSYIYDRDIPLLKEMGTNTIRLWAWKNDNGHMDFLNKAYKNGMYVIASFYVSPKADISDPDVIEKLKSDFRKMVAKHKNHPAILMWSVGNELNKYHGGKNLDDVFGFINEMAREARLEEGDNYHPVTSTLQDTNTLEVINKYDPTMTYLDVWSVQLYKGKSFGPFFEKYSNVSTKPLVVMEFGIDAFDNINNREDERSQAIYVEKLWKEIDDSNIVVGGSVTTFTDGWWKSSERQGCEDNDPSFQGTCGREMGGFPDKFANDEWWGIARIDYGDSEADTVEPREAYYTLKSLWNKKSSILNVQGT